MEDMRGMVDKLRILILRFCGKSTRRICRYGKIHQQDKRTAKDMVLENGNSSSIDVVGNTIG